MAVFCCLTLYLQARRREPGSVRATHKLSALAEHIGVLPFVHTHVHTAHIIVFMFFYFLFSGEGHGSEGAGD